MSSEHPNLRKRGDYGFDGFSSRGLAAVAAGSAACVALTAVAFRMRRRLLGMVGASLLFVFVTIAPFRLHATRRGKFIVWAELLEELHLRGDERVLDLGCGRGAVATMVAKLVPGGTVVGLDLWTADQTGNSPAATTRNMTLEASWIGASSPLGICWRSRSPAAASTSS